MTAITSAAHAQDGGITVHLDARVIEPNEVIQGRLECVNTGAPESAPRAAVPPAVQLRLTTAVPSQMQSLRSINGVTTTETRYTFRFTLTASEPGNYVVGPFEIDAGGTTYTAESQNIRVVEVGEEDKPKGDSYIFAEMNVTPRSLYVTQTYTATLTIGIRKVVHERRYVDLNLLSDVLDQQASQFSIFGGGDLTRTQRTLTDSNGSRHLYEVFEVRKTVRAEEPGTVTVGPVFLRANYPLRLRRGFGFFSSYEVVSSRKETARADEITIEVKAPPAAGRPPDFKGAIGSYNMNVEAKPTRLAQGSPLTLTIEVRGDPLAGVAGPDLSRNAELASRFDFAKDELVGDIERGAKVFRRAIFPKHEGPQTIPPIRWSFFDPISEQYVTRESDPIDIVVDAPTLESRRIVLHDEAGANGGDSTLTAIAGGVAPNYTDANLLLADQRFTMGPGWAAAVGAPPAMYLLSSLLVRRRARLRGDPGHARRHRARRRTDAGFARAAKLDDPRERLHAIAETFKGYVADRLLLAEGHLTRAELRVELQRRGVDETLLEEIDSFLAACESARYAPGAIESIDPERATTSARAWMKAIDTAAAKRSPFTPSHFLTFSLPPFLTFSLSPFLTFSLSHLLTFALLLTATPPAHAQLTLTPEAELQAGLEDYDRAVELQSTQPDEARRLFLSAAKRWTRITDDGIAGGHLEFNIGNAYLHAGDTGRAILHYRRAERLIPGDPYLQNNLEIARARCLSPITTTRQRSILRSLFFLHYAVSLPARTRAALVAFALIWVFLLIRLVAIPRPALVGAVLSAIVAVSLGVSVGVDRWSQRRTPEGVVTEMDVVAYQGPGTGYQRKFVEPLQPGVEFTRLQRRGEWQEIELPDTQTGWIRNDQAELIAG